MKTRKQLVSLLLVFCIMLALAPAAAAADSTYTPAVMPNQVFTREQLLDHIWGYEYIGDTRTVDVHINRLRDRFRDIPYFQIQTVRGLGYKGMIEK